MTKKLREDIGRVGHIIYYKDLDAKLIPECSHMPSLSSRLNVRQAVCNSWFVIVAHFCHSLCSSTVLTIIVIDTWFCHNLRSLGYKLW